MPRQRRFHACMAAVAVLGGIAQILLGSAEIALTFAPLPLIAGLLISGRYLGEADPRPPGRSRRAAAASLRRPLAARGRAPARLAARPLAALGARTLGAAHRLT